MYVTNPVNMFQVISIMTDVDLIDFTIKQAESGSLYESNHLAPEAITELKALRESLLDALESIEGTNLVPTASDVFNYFKVKHSREQRVIEAQIAASAVGGLALLQDDVNNYMGTVNEIFSSPDLQEFKKAPIETSAILDSIHYKFVE